MNYVKCASSFLFIAPGPNLMLCLNDLYVVESLPYAPVQVKEKQLS